MDKEGNATKISRIKAAGFIRGRYKGKEIKIKFADILKLKNIENYHFRVTNKADKQFVIENSTMYTRKVGDRYVDIDLKYYYYDEISMKEKAVDFKTGDVHTLTFGINIGRLKFNQRTKKFFPSDYLYDPFSAEKLVWKDPAY